MEEKENPQRDAQQQFPPVGGWVGGWGYTVEEVRGETDQYEALGVVKERRERQGYTIL